MVAASKPEYGVVIARNIGVIARDGTRLALDIYRPARDGEPLPGPFPAILTRSPYDTRSGKGPSSQQRNGEFFARHGYLYCVSDTRGRYESDGDFVLLDRDGEDGHDVIEAIAALPYCDGHVGTQGTSLRAWNQNAAALERPPHLRCMWINQGGSNGQRTALRHNGALELRWLSWAVTYSPLSKEAIADPALQRRQVKEGERLYEWFKRLPWSEGDSPLAGVPSWERWALDLYREAESPEFWSNPSRNFEPHIEKSADVPTMYAGAWYDSYSLATTDKFLWFKDRLRHQFLMMGPGIHGGPNFDNRITGEVDMGAGATIARNLAPSRLHMMLAFYDRFLKGVANGFEATPKVRIFVMGGGGGKRTPEGRLLHGGAWRDEADWPLARAVETPFFLAPDGALSRAAPAGEGSASFVHDPAHPLPTVAGNVSSLTEQLPLPRGVKMPDPITFRRAMVIQGAADQVLPPDLHGGPPYGPLQDRADTLVFETPPLTEPMEVTGPVRIVLHLSSDAPDTDLFAMLLDIYPRSAEWPEGYRMNITDSLMRVRYREGLSTPKLMRAGEVVEVAFELYPTSNLFDAGHRLQLLIGSASFPRFDVNPNTGEPIGRHTHSRKARNTIHFGAAHPSRLILPIVPR